VQNEVDVDTHYLVGLPCVPLGQVLELKESSHWETRSRSVIVVCSVPVANAREPQVELEGVKLDWRSRAELSLGEVESPAWVRFNESSAETVPEVLVCHDLQWVFFLWEPHWQLFTTVGDFTPALDDAEPESFTGEPDIFLFDLRSHIDREINSEIFKLWHRLGE